MTKLLVWVGEGGEFIDNSNMPKYSLDSFYAVCDSLTYGDYLHWIVQGQFSNRERRETALISASCLAARALCFFLSPEKSFYFDAFFYLKKKDTLSSIEKEIRTVISSKLKYTNFTMTQIWPKPKFSKNPQCILVNSYLSGLDKLILQKVMKTVNIFYRGNSDITYSDIINTTRCSDPIFKDFIKAMDTDKEYVLTSHESDISTTFHVTPINFSEEDNFAMIIFNSTARIFDLNKFNCPTSKIICVVHPIHTHPIFNELYTYKIGLMLNLPFNQEIDQSEVTSITETFRTITCMLLVL